jgi:hypothetical protein
VYIWAGVELIIGFIEILQNLTTRNYRAYRLQAPYYLNRVDHIWKIRARMIRTDVGKFSFVNRTITEWNQLPEGTIGTPSVKTHTFRKRVRKVQIRELK